MDMIYLATFLFFHHSLNSLSFNELKNCLFLTNKQEFAAFAHAISSVKATKPMNFRAFSCFFVVKNSPSGFFFKRGLKNVRNVIIIVSRQNHRQSFHRILAMSIFKKDQLFEELRESILAGRYQDGMKLPPEKDFAAELGVGKITLRSALARLEAERLVTRVRGQGTFVSYRAESCATRSIVNVYSEEIMDGQRVFAPRLLAEFHLQAKELNFNELNLTVEQLSNTTPEELALYARKANVACFFLFPHGFRGDEPWLKLIRDLGYPVILTNAVHDDHELTGCAAVTLQQADGLKQCLRLFADCQYHRVGIIYPHTPYKEILLAMNARQIIHECAVNGLEGSLDRIQACKSDRHEIRQIIAKWLAEPNPPDAFIIGLGNASLFSCETFKEFHLEIGRDIGLIVHTNDENTLAINGISTISGDIPGITRKSFQLLLEADKWFPPAPDQRPPNRYHYLRLTQRDSLRNSNLKNVLSIA